MVDMHFIVSSNLEQIGYDADTAELHIRFKDGSLYVYADVPPHVFDELTAAPSAGSYLNREIKGVYSYDKRE